MSYSIPQTIGQLVTFSKDLASGLTTYATALKITQITPTQLTNAIGKLMAADQTFNAGRSAVDTAYAAYKPTVDALGTWLLMAKNSLAGRFGSRYNQQWAQAGFVAPSTAIPRKLDDQVALTLRIEAALRKNPTWPVSDLGFTPTIAAAKVSDLQAAYANVTAAEMRQKDNGTARDGYWTALTDLARQLVSILFGCLGPDDPRWQAFGLPLPSQDTTPGQPVNVTAHMDGTGTGNIVVQCDAVPLATRYRWRTLLVGQETDYSLAAGTSEPMAALTGFLPGKTVSIIVQGANASRQGVASDAIEFTVPLTVRKVVAEPTAEARGTAKELPALIPTTNGNGRHGKARG